MKEKIAALILCTIIMTASWLSLAKQPAQAVNLSWLSGNQSIYNRLVKMLGTPKSTAPIPTTPAAPGTGTDTTKPDTENDTTPPGSNGGEDSNTDGTSAPDAGNNTPDPAPSPEPVPDTDSTDLGTANPPADNNSGNGSSGSAGTVDPPADSSTGSPGSGTVQPPVEPPSNNNGSTTVPQTEAEKNYQKYMSHYLSHEAPLVESFRNNYDGSLAQALVGRAIWYMENGYMVYGHKKYWDTGYIDCSNFVSLVYKDFGYSITSTARKYTTVGTKVSGVSSKKQSNGKWTLTGVDKLRPGDILTYWNTDENGKYISHVAIYMGLVDGKPAIINTRKEHPTAIGIINNFSYWYGEQLYEVRRVLPESAFMPNSNVKLSEPVIPAVYQLKPQKPIIMPKDLPKGF